MEPSQKPSKLSKDNTVREGGSPGAQARTSVPFAPPALAKTSAAACLLDVVARESSPEGVPPATTQQAASETKHLSRLRRSPSHAATRGLDDLLRASASPMARSPHTPRSPFSARASSAPSSPDLAAANLHPHHLGLAPSTSSLEYILANAPSLHNSLSCSSFPIDSHSLLPSISPEPFSALPTPPLPAFRQHRLQSPLSAVPYGARELPSQWMPAASPQRVRPEPETGPHVPSGAKAAAPHSRNASHPGIPQGDSAPPALSDTAPAESQAVSAEEWLPSRTRRSKRTHAHKPWTVQARPGRRTSRSGRGPATAAGAPAERAAVPPAIKRLRAHHGNRGVTRFRSVSLMVRTGRYDVTPHHFKRQVYLGSYETAEQAGRVADLAEVAAGKTGTRLNFEGEYGAEMERAAEVAAQPGMTADALKAWVIQTHEHIKNINRTGRAGIAAEDLECVPSSLQTHISQMVHQDSISLGFYLSKDRASSAYDQVMVQALGLKAQTNFSITNYKHLLSEEDRDEVEKAEQQMQAGNNARC